MFFFQNPYFEKTAKLEGRTDGLLSHHQRPNNTRQPETASKEPGLSVKRIIEDMLSQFRLNSMPPASSKPDLRTLTQSQNPLGVSGTTFSCEIILKSNVLSIIGKVLT